MSLFYRTCGLGFLGKFRFCLPFLLGLSFGALTAGAEAPAGSKLLSGETDGVAYYGSGDASAVVREVAVEGQAFARALRVDTFDAKTSGKGEQGLIARISEPVDKGDVLWISFKARRLESRRETGEAAFELRFDQLVNGKYVWPPHLERGISVGAEWTDISIPFLINKATTPADSRLVIKFDSYPQSFELGPITFLNCGSGVRPAELPRSVVHYDGDAPDAAWRAAAAERIERLRKGDLEIKVTDAQGRPIPGAEVSVRMKRIAFNFGTATSSQRLLDERPESTVYRENLRKYFNQVVFENEMKWPAWSNPDYEPAGTRRALNWLDAQGIPARGHVMVWPSWGHLPKFMAGLKDDPGALHSAVLRNIEKQTRLLRGRFVEWDVTNELYAHHDLVTILGREELVKWYQAAHAGDPGVKLFYNEYTMFHADGPGSASEHYYNTVKFLKEQGAPLSGIGEQGHIGGTPPGIPLVLARLDKFSSLGLPITITEFDINSNDEDFQAAYLRDFLTAVFSHPGAIGFVQWGFWEGQHWFPSAALWNKDWTLRKHGGVFTELVGKTWRTDYDGRTSEDGGCRLRAFCGEYIVTVKQAGRTVTRLQTVGTQGGTLTVKL